MSYCRINMVLDISSELRSDYRPNFDYHNRRNPYHETVAIKGVTSQCIMILSLS